MSLDFEDRRGRSVPNSYVKTIFVIHMNILLRALFQCKSSKKLDFGHMNHPDRFAVIYQLHKYFSHKV